MVNDRGFADGLLLLLPPLEADTAVAEEGVSPKCVLSERTFAAKLLSAAAEAEAAEAAAAAVGEMAVAGVDEEDEGAAVAVADCMVERSVRTVDSN